MIREKCGVFGVFGQGLEAARLVHTGLWTLQHRGQESSGICASDGRNLVTHKGPGLVAHVYDEEVLRKLPGPIAVGHNRYSTSGGASAAHAQPVTGEKNILALAHNGNLPDVSRLKSFLQEQGVSTVGANDSELMHRSLEHCLSRGASLRDAVHECFDLFTGVFSLLLMTRHQLAAVRDAHGIRPLSMGALGNGFAFASETCALDAIGASFVRDITPGELVILGEDGPCSSQIREGDEKLDIFEFVYFARPDSLLLGRRVNEVRRNLGANLAREHPVSADVVVPVPDSAVPAALGYAEVTGIPFDFGLLKNRYIHRTFIRPAQNLRQSSVRMKLNALPEVLRGKRVAVVDDSIVRGTTAGQLVELLRRHGAREVHFLVSSPPVRFPDFYGIDTPEPAELVAAARSVDETRQWIHADSLAYLSYQGMIQATGLPAERFSTACFNGVYPVDVGQRAAAA